MSELTGKVAVVTGASAGIGRSAAIALAAAGAAVLLADLDNDRGETAAEEIRSKGGQARFVVTDVTDDDQVAAMVAAAVESFGGVDLAFNNAGIEGSRGPTAECSKEDWDRTLAVNLTGVWYCMRHELPRMVERGGGSIVNCSSVAGLVGAVGVPAYVASKHGVVGLSRAAALEYLEAGVRVNAVCPGVIATEMMERWAGGKLTGLFGRPEDIAETVVWLCSERSTFVTGQAIAVDGGFVAR